MGEVVDHPLRALMAEVNAEREIASSPEAEALQDKICDAVMACFEYLADHGLIYNDECDLMHNHECDLHLRCKSVTANGRLRDKT